MNTPPRACARFDQLIQFSGLPSKVLEEFDMFALEAKAQSVHNLLHRKTLTSFPRFPSGWRFSCRTCADW